MGRIRSKSVNRKRIMNWSIFIQSIFRNKTRKNGTPIHLLTIFIFSVGPRHLRIDRTRNGKIVEGEVKLIDAEKKEDKRG